MARRVLEACCVGTALAQWSCAAASTALLVASPPSCDALFCSAHPTVEFVTFSAWPVLASVWGVGVLVLLVCTGGRSRPGWASVAAVVLQVVVFAGVLPGVLAWGRA